MVKDDLWSDSADELIDAGVSIDLVAQETEISTKDSAPTAYPKSLLKKTTLIKVAESDISSTYLFEHLQTLDEDEELTEVWNNSRQGLAREGNNTESSFVEPPQSDFEGSSGLLTIFEDTPALRGFERAVESSSFLDGFEFIDIEAELADLERVEAELAVGKSSVEHEGGTVSRRGRVQAPGWMGSSSLLYINWDDEEKAEKEALERLGYSRINLSDATRTFIIQAARAYKLTLRQERLITNQLAKAYSLLAQLPNSDDCESLRNELRAEIVDLERTLVYNLQWVAVKKA